MAKPKVSHLQKTQKADQPNKAEIQGLAGCLAGVLNNPACPDRLFNAIVDALSDLQSSRDTRNADFIVGVLLSQPRQKETAG